MLHGSRPISSSRELPTISAARELTYKMRGGCTSICATYIPMPACSAALSIARHSVAPSSGGGSSVFVAALYHAAGQPIHPRNHRCDHVKREPEHVPILCSF